MYSVAMKLGGAILLFAVSPPAFGQGLPPALATGEISLQIASHGEAHNAADIVTVNVPITASGNTAVAARQANQVKLDALKQALVARGIDQRSIVLAPAGGAKFGFIGNEAIADEDSDSPALAARMSRKNAQSVLQIRLSDPARLPTVRDVLDGQNEVMMGAPIFALVDDRAARHAAVADAVTKARREADDYASAVGMRVSRIVRISDQAPQQQGVEGYTHMMQLFGGLPSLRPNDVETDADVTIDFLLTSK